MVSPGLNVEEVFLQAVEKGPAARTTFLDAACADGTVRTRVEALLKAHDTAGDFLDGPALRSAPPSGSQTFPAAGGDTTSAGEPPAFLDRCDTPGRVGRLAHYEILGVLGRGGMGVVLRGMDVKLNRVVAIKVLAPHRSADATARTRVLREARAAAAVSHPHVVAIHGVDEFNGLPYLVMEYVAGPSLQQKIDGGALPLAQILRIGVQVASGLAAAHAQGLVHRDIKPANILLENGVESAKITDFGLARAIDDIRLTREGAVYGTPQYMSPEQARGDPVDLRSDLFSLGSVMYAMGTGRPPFRGETGLAVLRRVCDDTPRPIREVNPDIPEALAEIVHKLLAKNPDDRFQSAGAVADLLSRYLAHVQHDRIAPFLVEDQPQPGPGPTGRGGQSRQRTQHPARSGTYRPLVASAAVILLTISAVAAVEGTRHTNWAGLVSPWGAAVNEEAPAAAATLPAAPSNRARHAAGATDRPVKVFVLAGDSNMAGRSLSRLLKSNPARTKSLFRHLLPDGGWLVRDDVWVKNLDRRGNLTVGFGDTPERIGPELEFGQVVGDHFDEQVLLIKTCWGGHRLRAEFRSPSSGPAPDEVLEEVLQEMRPQKPDATLADAKARCGVMYRDMLAEVRQTLANLGEHFPAYRGQGFELAGFVWFSGWTDMAHPNYSYGYSAHLANLIRDVRTDLGVPDLPVVVGQMGVSGGEEPGKHGRHFRGQQAAAADLPEFAGNVTLVATDPYWDREAHAVYRKGWKGNLDEWERYGSDQPYHYLGSAQTNVLIGRAFGEAVLALRRVGANN